MAGASARFQHFYPGNEAFEAIDGPFSAIQHETKGISGCFTLSSADISGSCSYTLLRVSGGAGVKTNVFMCICFAVGANIRCKSVAGGRIRCM